MNPTAELTFRDFAGAMMSGNADEGARVLGVLMQLDAATARSATSHFQKGMASGPEFMGKAMGMRAALTSGSTAELLQLVIDCFGLDGAKAQAAVAALSARYASPPPGAEEPARRAAQAEMKAAANEGSSASAAETSGTIATK